MLNEIWREFHSNFWYPLSAQELKAHDSACVQYETKYIISRQNSDICILIYLFI
jgi:hypothetical protein